NGYSDNILVKLFISEIVHTEDSFLLKLYYKFNFATEPQLLFHLFAAFAEFERNLILERSSAGRIAARARGRYGGRPEKLSNQDLNLLKTLYDNGTPIKTIAEQWQVSRTTIYRYLNKLEEKEDEKQGEIPH
ncbi:recombinase family protein, partial [Staphylococcus cohnii]|uniref:recombinase family protein n=1 Tax=Staphylococcus cohnii TaxID=29382 RepID=UPI001F35DFB2